MHEGSFAYAYQACNQDLKLERKERFFENRTYKPELPGRETGFHER